MENNNSEYNMAETNTTENNLAAYAANTDKRKQFSHIGLVLFLGTLLTFGVQILAGMIASNIPAIANNSNLTFLAPMLAMYIVAFPLTFLMFRKVPATISGEKKKMRPLHLFAAFLMCYAGMYICNIFGTIITSIIGIIKQDAVDNVMLEVIGSINPIVNLFIVVICAPIMEELLFRKHIIDRTAKYGEGVSIVFSGLLFGLFHGNLAQFAYAFFLGIFFGFIYIKTKNIVYPIILHMLINFFGSFIGQIILEVTNIMEIAEATTSGASETELMNIMMENMTGLAIYFFYLMFILCCVLAGVIIFIVNKKKFTLNAGEITIKKGQRFKTVILNLGVILFNIFWIIQIILQLI